MTTFDEDDTDADGFELPPGAELKASPPEHIEVLRSVEDHFPGTARILRGLIQRLPVRVSLAIRFVPDGLPAAAVVRANEDDEDVLPAGGTWFFIVAPGRVERVAANRFDALVARMLPVEGDVVPLLVELWQFLDEGFVLKTKGDLEHLFAPEEPPEYDEGRYADRALADVFHVPERRGDHVTFFVNESFHDPGTRILRITVDLVTGSVRRDVVGQGRFAGYLEGRGYSVGAVNLFTPLEVSSAVAGVDDDRRRKARTWRDRAIAEHASIASFARGSLELMAVGAPMDLVERTHEAALDEIEHARLCLEVASSLDGATASFGPLPALAPRPASLARILEDTRVEAAEPEAAAAARAAREAQEEAWPPARAALLRIAADEARHAQLARDIVAWCVDSCAEVPHALDP